MDINQILLLQAANALQHACQVRNDLHVALYEQMKSADPLSPFGVLKTNMEAYGSELSQAISVTCLYASHYSTEYHRTLRVVKMVEHCRFWHRRVEHAMFHDSVYWDNKVRLAKRPFADAESMIYLAVKALNAVTTVSWSTESSVDTDVKIPPVRTSKSSVPFKEPVDAADYLRHRSYYERRHPAHFLLYDLTVEEVDSALIEKIDVSFRLLSVSPDFLYEGPSKDDRYSYHVVKCLNVVWQFALTAEVTQAKGELAYRTAYHQIYDEDPNNTVDPVILAKVMRKHDIYLGFIFEGDVSAIVWPLGKGNIETSSRSIIYDSRGIGGHRYLAVQLLEPGIKPLPHETTTNKVLLLYKDRLRGLKRPAERGTYLGFNSDAEPFPFFRLPAELRNKIYEHYLTPLRNQTTSYHWKSRYGGPRRQKSIKIPRLAQTSRQLRDEVLSKFLASTPFDLLITPYYQEQSPRCLVEDQILTAQNWKLVSIPAAANITEIRVFVGEVKRDWDFRLSKNGSESELVVSGDWQTKGDSGVSTLYEQLQKLVDILLEDSTSSGLSLVEIAVIAESISKVCQKRK